MRPAKNTTIDSFLGSAFFLLFGLLLLGFCLFWYRPSGKMPILATRNAPRVQASPSSEAPLKTSKTSQETNPSADQVAVQAATSAVPVVDEKLAADLKARLDKAMDLVDDDKVDEAIPILEQILREDKNNELALIELGMIQLIDLKDTPAALSYLERALKANPDNNVIISEIAGIYESAQLGDQGLAFFEELNSEHPDNPNVANGLAQMLTQKRRFQDAQPYYEMVAQKSQTPEAYSDLAGNLSKLGQGEQAIEYRRKAIEQREANFQTQSAMGMSEEDKSQHRDGVILDYMRLGQEQIKQGDMRAAEKTVDELRKLGFTEAEISEVSQRKAEQINY